MKRMAIAALAVAVSLSASVSAQQGQGKGKGNGKGESSVITFALSLVTDNNSNGVPNWGDQISFQIFTTETTDPRVQVMCFQDGDVVYGALWQPNNSVLTLSSRAWQGGTADCTASRYYIKDNKIANLDSTAITVEQ